MNTFYQKILNEDFSIQHVTKGALTQARSKLKPEAFKELNKVGTDSFYQNAPYLKWLEYRLLGIDGSTCVLPKHESIEKEFGVVNFGPYASSPQSVARISLLYDVLNLTTIDIELSGYTTSENALAKRHLEIVKPGKDLLLFDRLYASVPLMFEMKCRGIDFCIRLREDWWHEVRKMLKDGEKDKLVTFKLGKKARSLMDKYQAKSDEIQCRLIVVGLADGGIEILCTSVLDNEKLPYECFKDLYHCRWSIEEGYKLYKSRADLETFSGKTAKSIKQDIFAKMFMMTTMAVLAFPIEEKIKQEHQQKTTERKHPHKINRTNALAMVKEMWFTLFIKKRTNKALAAFDSIVQATTEIIRPNRMFPRKYFKKIPPSMGYKLL